MWNIYRQNQKRGLNCTGHLYLVCLEKVKTNYGIQLDLILMYKYFWSTTNFPKKKPFQIGPCFCMLDWKINILSYTYVYNNQQKNKCEFIPTSRECDHQPRAGQECTCKNGQELAYNWPKTLPRMAKIQPRIGQESAYNDQELS